MKKNDVAAMEWLQINVKVPWVVAVGAKRLARQRGVPLNTLVTDILSRELQAEAAALRQQILEEEREAATEHAALREFFEQGSPADEKTSDRGA
ncbi:hypothetical protein [Nocardia aurantia]|uniref:Uncharacterized protein n=1 Tax=Nocardia aurantia TaxID=2585199 RepID=A0A7K0DMX8_9NOCA|nr:hypothetical protein [Nocardia aurantia]MQY27079.1 hypothetical protein [Nocardia aurantia]